MICFCLGLLLDLYTELGVELGSLDGSSLNNQAKFKFFPNRSRVACKYQCLIYTLVLSEFWLSRMLYVSHKQVKYDSSWKFVICVCGLYVILKVLMIR